MNLKKLLKELGYQPGDGIHTSWSKEDDGTYTRILVITKSVYTIRGYSILEEGVREEEYFRRALAGKL